MAAEEERVYPIEDERLGVGKSREAQKEHDTARDGMAEMIAQIESEGFADAVAKFKDINHHVEEEEGELFPQLRQKAGDEIAALGDAPEVEEELGDEV